MSLPFDDDLALNASLKQCFKDINEFLKDPNNKTIGLDSVAAKKVVILLYFYGYITRQTVLEIKSFFYTLFPKATDPLWATNYLMLLLNNDPCMPKFNSLNELYSLFDTIESPLSDDLLINSIYKELPNACMDKEKHIFFLVRSVIFSRPSINKIKELTCKNLYGVINDYLIYDNDDDYVFFITNITNLDTTVIRGRVLGINKDKICYLNANNKLCLRSYNEDYENIICNNTSEANYYLGADYIICEPSQKSNRFFKPFKITYSGEIIEYSELETEKYLKTLIINRLTGKKYTIPFLTNLEYYLIIYIRVMKTPLNVEFFTKFLPQMNKTYNFAKDYYSQISSFADCINGTLKPKSYVGDLLITLCSISSGINPFIDNFDLSYVKRLIDNSNDKNHKRDVRELIDTFESEYLNIDIISENSGLQSLVRIGTFEINKNKVVNVNYSSLNKGHYIDKLFVPVPIPENCSGIVCYDTLNKMYIITVFNSISNSAKLRIKSSFNISRDNIRWVVDCT